MNLRANYVFIDFFYYFHFVALTKQTHANYKLSF
jgi:hypothetical protein